MHSEWVDGVILRPTKDAGFSAWRGDERVGVARLVVGTIEVDAADGWIRRLLYRRVAAEARAVGIPLKLPLDESLLRAA
jgi:hypothetical protein